MEAPAFPVDQIRLFDEIDYKSEVNRETCYCINGLLYIKKVQVNRDYFMRYALNDYVPVVFSPSVLMKY